MKTDPGWVPIPGETPIDDVSGLLIKDIGTRGQLNQAEAENIALVVAKYFVGRLTEVDAPFTFDWMFALHKEMFGRVWAWAGTPRTCNLNLGCPAHDVEANVLGLIQDISYWGKGPYSLIEDAALLHYRAVKIHPFLNGNGRWARMLANIWLRLHGADPVMWPEPQIGESQSDQVRVHCRDSGGRPARLCATRQIAPTVRFQVTRCHRPPLTHYAARTSVRRVDSHQ